MWSDSLAPYLDNPLLVEVKDRLSEDQLAATLAQVTNIAHAASVHWALLIYRSGPPQAVLERHASEASRVLLISLSELLDGLATKSLFVLLRSLRNQKVHGATG